MYILNKISLGKNRYKFEVGQLAGRNALKEWCGKYSNVLSGWLFKENLVTCLQRASSAKATPLLRHTSNVLLVWGPGLPDEPSYDMGLESVKGRFALCSRSD